MELTTIELAKKLITKANKIEVDFKCAVSEDDRGYYIKVEIVDSVFFVPSVDIFEISIFMKDKQGLYEIYVSYKSTSTILSLFQTIEYSKFEEMKSEIRALLFENTNILKVIGFGNSEKEKTEYHDLIKSNLLDYINNL